MAVTVDSYIEQNKSRFLEELLSFIRIPSISTLPEHKNDVAKAAAFVADAMREVGIEKVEVIKTAKHPLVYGDWLHAPGQPTVLCYGHYDVQPPDPLELWETPPFDPSIRHGNIYARGAADDKGQMYMHIKAVEALRAAHEGRLPVNVKFLIEGEEEVGGESISAYVPKQKEKLQADVALVSDTELFADGLPTLCIGLRGLMYLEIEAVGPARDLHSGIYGGAAPNAVYGLVQLLAKAKDAHGRIQIPGIYDDVAAPDAVELESWKRLPFTDQEFLEHIGASALTGEPDQPVLARLWARPTFEVHGITGGFTGVGAKTVIPAKAVAKVSLRLVPDQDPQKILAAVKDWVSANTPEGVQTQVRVLSGANTGILVNPHHPAIDSAAKAFSETLGKPTVFVRGGGSIPIVGDFARELQIPTVLMGFGLPDDGLHSPNEKFRIANYYLGIRTISHFLEDYGASAEG